MERGQQGIIDDIKKTLMGSVRSVVAKLTPEQVQNDKESFKKEIEEVKSIEEAPGKRHWRVDIDL
jgi:uncharacterized membrane protein YqiK